MTKRAVISKSEKKFNRPKGSAYFIYTEQVVYKTQNPDGTFTSQTRHELDKSRR